MFLILLEIKKAKIMQKENTYLENEEDSEIFSFVNKNLSPQNILVKAFIMVFFFICDGYKHRI